jgi:AGCS family alanine or glycine:cation symporter
MDKFTHFLSAFSGLVWGWPLIIILFGTHLFLTFRLGFIQKHLWTAIKLSISRKNDGAGDVNPFAALTTALAATIGTGNIVGVASAIALGGPGAVLWMWFTGVFGIATKYTEAFLAVRFRVQNAEGQMIGGPMLVLERGLKMKWLAVLFAAFTAVAAFGIGNMVQANGVAELLHSSFSIPRYATGIFLTLITAVVILGGIKSIARYCEGLVPFMAIFYILGCLILLAMNLGELPHTIKLIITDAFSTQAALGGFLGAGIKEAMRYGIARGLFSNESGLGSAPIVAAAAQTRHTARQALISSTGTFWDTVVICLLTGLVIVNSGTWTLGHSGSLLTKDAFSKLPTVGPFILGVGLFTFVYSTILGWAYYGEKAVEYLFGLRSVLPYRVLWVVAVFVGSTLPLSAVWDFADIANAFMALPNIFSLLLLSGLVARETKSYFQNEK